MYRSLSPLSNFSQFFPLFSSCKKILSYTFPQLVFGFSLTSLAQKRQKISKKMTIEVVTWVHMMYLVFYTGFDKKTKSLNFSQLLDVLGFRRSVEFTIKETNKVLALAGLTLIAYSVISTDRFMLLIAAIELIIHGLYSSYAFYGSNNIPKISDWTISKTAKEISSRNAKERLLSKRKLSILCSLISSIILETWLLGYLDWTPLVINTFLSLSVIHFYTMEIDFRGKLHVRPFGFLAFVVPIVAIGFSTYLYYKFSEIKSEYPFAFSSK